jgi:hypothetical protein
MVNKMAAKTSETLPFFNRLLLIFTNGNRLSAAGYLIRRL